MQQQNRFRDPLSEVADPAAVPPGVFNEAGVRPGMEATVIQPETPEPFAEAPLARRPDQPRNLQKIKQALKIDAGAWGNKWMWGWEVNDKRRGKVWIEGPTVKMANAIVRQYGNCVVDSRVFDLGSRWMIYARFIDLETGYTRVRPFAQRKSIDMGIKDDARALDMSFQAAVSRAERNVVVNALPELVEFCKDEAKNATYDEIQKDPEKARKWIVKNMQGLNIDRAACEKVYGRTAEHWTVPDMARIVVEVESVKDGMVNAADLYAVAEEGEINSSAPAAAPKPEQQQRQPAAAPQQPAPAAAPKGEAKPPMVFTEEGEHVGVCSDPKIAVGAPLQLESGLYQVTKIKEGDKGGPKKIIVKKHEAIPGGAQAQAAPAAQQQESRPPQGLPAREPSAPRKKLFGKG